MSMKNQKRAVIVFSLILALVTSLAVHSPVYAAKKAGLSQSKLTLTVGGQKTLEMKNTSKKVSWKILSGKKNITLQKKKSSVKITGKKAGSAKIQAKVADEKYTCKVMIQAAQTSGERKIKVQSDNYTVVYQLNNSKAADDLYQQLPLTIEVENYEEGEKIFYPPTPLDTENAPKSNGKKGTLAYYAPWDDVVMFYGTSGPASGLYELGMVVSGGSDVSKLKGKITITRN